jgi:hypothetical protein
MLYRVHLSWAGFELTTLVVIGTDCIGSYKPNYHTITTALRMELHDQLLYDIFTETSLDILYLLVGLKYC